jgi:hypothetical protein
MRNTPLHVAVLPQVLFSWQPYKGRYLPSTPTMRLKPLTLLSESGSGHHRPLCPQIRFSTSGKTVQRQFPASCMVQLSPVGYSIVGGSFLQPDICAWPVWCGLQTMGLSFVYVRLRTGRFNCRTPRHQVSLIVAGSRHCILQPRCRLV